MFGSRKTMSEEEYVEKVRKHVCAVQRVRPVFLAMFSMMVCLVIFILYTVPGMLSKLPYERFMVYGGMIMGVFIGFLFTTYVAVAVQYLKLWFDFRHGFRTEKLLLDYHDRLKALGALPAAAERADSRPSTDSP